MQIDDVFVGDERQSGGVGRVAPNKVLVVAAVQASPQGQAICTRLDVVPNWQKTAIAKWALKALAADTHVVSDGLATFAAVKLAGDIDRTAGARHPLGALAGGFIAGEDASGDRCLLRIL